MWQTWRTLLRSISLFRSNVNNVIKNWFGLCTYISVCSRHIWNSHSSGAIPSGVSRSRRPSRTGRVWKNVSVWLTTYVIDLIWPLDTKQKNKNQLNKFALLPSTTLFNNNSNWLHSCDAHSFSQSDLFACDRRINVLHTHTHVRPKTGGEQNSQKCPINWN